ncbi:TPA: hypothetical protein ACH3X1_003205 [Trebouxia sp. C0004]
MTSIVRNTHNVPAHVWTTPINGRLPTNTFPNHSDDVHRASKSGNPACTAQSMLTAICPAPPHRQAPLRIYGGYAEMLCPDIGDRKVPRREEQAVADLSSLQSVSPVAHPACESSDMHKLMMHANPITTASQLLSRIRQAPIDNHIKSSPAGLHSMSSQTVHVPSASLLPALSVPASVNCLTPSPPGQSQSQRHRHVHEHTTGPRHGEKRKLPSIRPQLDYIGLRSQSQEQLVSNMAGRAVPLWQDDMAFGAELTQRPKRSACACSAQVQEFDRMHSTHSKEYGLAIGPLNIPRGTARPGQALLRHDDSTALLRHDDSTALLRHDDSPATSVEGQSWPYACTPEAAAEISSGIKSLVSSHVPSQQSPYFLGSQQQPLFLTTFDMPLEAPPPPAYGPSMDTPGRGVPALSPKAMASQLDAVAPSMVTLAPGAAVTDPDMAMLIPQSFCKSPQRWKEAF